MGSFVARIDFVASTNHHQTNSSCPSGTIGSTPVGYHALPWPSAASGTPGLLAPASARADPRHAARDVRLGAAVEDGLAAALLEEARAVFPETMMAEDGMMLEVVSCEEIGERGA